MVHLPPPERAALARLREALEAAEAALPALDPEDLPEALAQWEKLRAILSGRWVAHQVQMALPDPALHEELVALEEAARRLGLTADYLYHHHGKEPYRRARVRLGRRVLFSARRLDRLIRTLEGQ